MTIGSPGAAGRARSVVEALRDAIVDGEFAPNQRLVEADLSERFEASRGSIRTALLELGAEGLVERVANRGARVRAVSLAEAIEITEVRMALEGLCAAKAATRLTEDDRDRLRGIGTAMQEAVRSGDLLGYSELNRELHALIRTLGGQSTAQAILERLRGQNVRHQFRLALHPGRAAVSLPQHLEIIEALGEGDRGAPGVQGQPELVAHVLPAQAFEDGLRGGLATQRADERVQLPVQLGVAQQVPGPDGLLHRGADAAQAVAVVLGEPRGRLRGAQALQDHPDLGDLDGLGERDRPHPGAPVLDAFHQAFGAELEERGADAPAAGPEPLGQVGFHQALVGGELAVDDRVAQSVGNRGGPSGGLLGTASCRRCCHPA